MGYRKVKDRVISEVLDNAPDRQYLAELVSDLVGIPSTTGNENEVARYLYQAFVDLGMRAELQEVEEGRNNVIGEMDTGRPGPSLMFMGHMDTSTYHRPNGPRGLRTDASIEGDWLYGLGASNMKSAFAAYLSSVEMVLPEIERLGGRIVIGGVVGETERAPVGAWRGRGYRGGGVGAEYMASHGVLADYCINGEPTAMRLQLGNAGYMFVEIRLTGYAQHVFSRASALDPLPYAVRAYDLLEGWSRTYPDRHQDTVMRPLVSIGAISGGEPFKPSRNAESCSLYLSVNFVRGQTVMSVEREIREVLDPLEVANVGLRCDIRTYFAKMPHLVSRSSSIVEAVSAGHERVVGKSIEMADPARYSVSSDNTIFASFGMDCVQYGAGGVNLSGGISATEPGVGEVVNVENLATCAKVYACCMVDLLQV